MSATADTIVVSRTPAPVRQRRVGPDRRGPSLSPRTAPHRRPARSTDTFGERAAPPSKRARTGIFVTFVLGILTVGLLGMLWINTSLAQGAFTLTDLQQQRAQLIEQEQQLKEQLARAEAPAQVEQAARAMGMVPQDVPVFLRLADGAILGNPIPQPVPIVPESTVPESTVPESTVPESALPETTVPESTVPESTLTEQDVIGTGTGEGFTQDEFSPEVQP